MPFVLFNKKNNNYLTHPVYGLWSCQTKEEANKTLFACEAYNSAMGYKFLEGMIEIKEVSEGFYQEKHIDLSFADD